jgi:hypothetical protein
MFQTEAEGMNASIAALRDRLDTIKLLSEQLNGLQFENDHIASVVDELSRELSTITTTSE